MSKRNFIITIALMLFIAATTSFAQVDKYQWKLVDTENDCQVYTSPVAGKGYIAAKASCIVPARMETIGVVLRDIANYPEWMEDCKETKMLKVVDDANDVFIFWLRQHIPLRTDRDMVMKSHVTIDYQKSQNIIFSDLTREMNYDSGKGYIRMPSFSSVISLDWIDRDHTRITFMIDPDLGEGLPHFIANPMIKTNPLKSLKRMMKVLKNPKYIEAGKTSKYNKLVEDAIKAGYVKP
ncbi:MAG: START domain-containing protein [Smithella sp.]|jgi:hypothetical protein